MRHVLLLALPAAACAAQLEVLSLLNWQRFPVGERAMAEGGAVVARVNGPGAGYANPAGLAGLDEPTVSGTVTAFEYTRVAARTPGGTATADDAGLKPNLVGFANALEGGDSGWAFTLASPVTWSSGLEVRSDLPGGSRRDNGRSTLEIAVAALSWGGRIAPQLNLGGGLEAWLTDYRYDTGTIARDGSTLLTAAYAERGRQLDLRATLGVQWEVARWRFGGLVRSPGWRLQGQGSINGASTSGDGTTTTQSDLADGAASFSLPLPWQIVLGAAWKPSDMPGLELEADLAMHGGSGRSDVFTSVAGTTTTISGATVTSTETIQPARTITLRPLFNPRLGLRYLLPNKLFDRTLHVHLGAYIERSPIDDSEIFSQLDLLGATGGLSAEKGPMLLTVTGAFVTSGTLTDAIGFVSSPASGLRPALDNPDASFAVRSFTMSVGSSYRF